MKRKAFYVVVTAIIAILSPAARSTQRAQTKATSEAEVQRLMSDFLTAFDNLDWPAFRKCWVDNPVVIFPSTTGNPTGKRTDTATEFETAWKSQFDSILASAAKRGVTKPPFQNIKPNDLRIDLLAPTVAVVTFHLSAVNNGVGRRMLVVVKTDAGWKISHLHASNMPLNPQ